MYVVTIIPLSRNMPMATLPYLSKTDMAPGVFVMVPFRSGQIVGLVLHSAPAADMKSQIRSMPFSLRSGVELLPGHHLPVPYITAIMNQIHTAQCNPHDFLEIIYNPDHAWIADMQWQNDRSILHAIQHTTAGRISEYERLLESSNQSVVVVVPGTQYARQYAGMFSGSVCITTHSQLQKYQAKKQHERTVIFTTLQFLSQLLHDVSIVVFDQYSSLLYQIYVRDQVYIDRVAIWVNLLLYSTRHTAYISDRVVRYGDYQYIADTSRFNYTLPAPIIVASPQPTSGFRTGQKTFEERQLDLVATWITNRQPERIVVICNQKEWYGYASCSKCGHIHLCDHCQRPMRVVRPSRTVVQFFCTGCNHTRPIDDVCPTCGGYTMEARRYGVDKYAEMLHSMFPGYDIHTMTADTKQVRSVVTAWQDYGGILVTTSKYFTEYMSVHPDAVYITPAVWSYAEHTSPETILREYLVLAEQCQNILLSAETWTRVCYDGGTEQSDWQNQALTEISSAQKYGMVLPCTLW